MHEGEPGKQRGKCVSEEIKGVEMQRVCVRGSEPLVVTHTSSAGTNPELPPWAAHGHMTPAPATHTVYLRVCDHVEVKGDTSQSTALISTTENNTSAQSTSADEYK